MNVEELCESLTSGLDKCKAAKAPESNAVTFRDFETFEKRRYSDSGRIKLSSSTKYTSDELNLITFSAFESKALPIPFIIVPMVDRLYTDGGDITAKSYNRII